MWETSQTCHEIACGLGLSSLAQKRDGRKIILTCLGVERKLKAFVLLSNEYVMEYDIPAIIQGYAHGYFLMANEEAGRSTLQWYSSLERALIPLDDLFHYPRSLRRVLNQERFSVAINRDFKGVVAGCADRETTWISPELQNIYWALHEAGWAHSFETWQGDRLAGGILGITMGGAFIGESMFYRISDGSKVAMVKLVERLRSRGFCLFDVQLMNPHLNRFGAYKVENMKYQRLLNKALKHRCSLI